MLTCLLLGTSARLPRGDGRRRRNGLSKRQPVVGVGPENEVLGVGLELAPPVGRVPRNDHDVPLVIRLDTPQIAPPGKSCGRNRSLTRSRGSALVNL